MSSKNQFTEDVALLPPEGQLDLTLDHVGMANVQMQVRHQGQLLPGLAQAGVSLVDRQARGIHMSRLFKVITDFSERELSFAWLAASLDQMLSSHQKLSDAGFLQVAFDLPVRRQALLSGESGWRSYPVRYEVRESAGHRTFGLTLKVLYSSTCPCSAALARQAVRERFLKDFAEREQVHVEQVSTWLGEKSISVPHSQRSEATIELTFSNIETGVAALPWIDDVENILGTAVQSAVKRADEQDFARLNALNLMFCEDAARRLKAGLLKHSDLSDFAIEVRHFESLHAHDVVARVRK